MQRPCAIASATEKATGATARAVHSCTLGAGLVGSLAAHVNAACRPCCDSRVQFRSSGEFGHVQVLLLMAARPFGRLGRLGMRICR
eukprot:15483163-Alexandrium_andersonii.AAC.1